MSQEEQMARAEAVQEKYTDVLMHKLHVVGVGIGLAQQGGFYTQQVALVVMVDKKVPSDELHPEDHIPDELDGVRVDVQEMGLFTAQ